MLQNHQCEHISQTKEDSTMFEKIKRKDLFHEYYLQWIKIYKEGAIRDITLSK